MQSLSTALYPATDSGYRIQWGTYGVIVKNLQIFGMFPKVGSLLSYWANLAKHIYLFLVGC
jgi:hypothetical protein